jgi:dimeric dUTPase (all-alpha-NTP-PPase superfamily)
MDDRLAEMFTLQRTLQERLAAKAGYEFPPQDPAKLMQDVLVAAYALSDEVHEATNETGWKPWATSNHLNREAYLAELVDAWHFFMNMCLLADITPDELYAGYLAKNQVNHDRQTNGYDGVKSKCPGCKRAYDEANGYIKHGSTYVATPWCLPVQMATDGEGRPTGREIPAWCAGVKAYVNAQGRPVWDQPTQTFSVS